MASEEHSSLHQAGTCMKMMEKSFVQQIIYGWHKMNVVDVIPDSQMMQDFSSVKNSILE
jgi:hypothetical protein